MNTRRDSLFSRTKVNRMLLVLLAAVLLGGVFVQITMLARISAESKAISKVSAEMRELTATKENLQVLLSMHQDQERISDLALKLGMVAADETSIRVIPTPEYVKNTLTQTVENTAAEKSMR